ncbi:tRNA pseudouridine(13) synthase TruD [Myxococcota bacterium]|nr:tRNA pseudouridine(13) synthase TruD [Myxococcota bacterium]
MTLPQPLRVTAGLEGSGGVLQARAEDFEVREILAYEPTGHGEHLFVELEKVGITTVQAIDRLARATGVRARDVGYAGMKDRHARATQWVSLPVRGTVPMPVATDELRVLRAIPNDKKIRRGHQRANRFLIVIRDVPAGGVERAERTLARLRETGVPNYFGPQRFGNDGGNVERALAFVRGDAPPPRDRRIRDLLISSVQSLIFNHAVGLRIERGLLGTALLGDVMQKHDTGGLFDVTAPDVEQPRADRLEISPTAALPGTKYRRASGDAQALEDEALVRSGIAAEDVARLDAEGTRRACRYPLDPDARIVPLAADVYRLEITLPSGAYATIVLDELVKPEGQPFDRIAV